MTEMDDVFSIDGKIDSSKEDLKRDLKYLRDLAERATQPPPKLNGDSEIQERYQRLEKFINRYG